jgi:hypothetical protein
MEEVSEAVRREARRQWMGYEDSIRNCMTGQDYNLGFNDAVQELRRRGVVTPEVTFRKDLYGFARLCFDEGQ